MLEQFHFILGWIKKNKIMTIVYLSVLVLIITSNMLLTQFFVNECKTDEVGKYYYAFYFNETIDKTKIKRMCTELEEELDVEDLMLVTKGNGDTYNDYKYGAFLIQNNKDLDAYNNSLSFGKWDNSRKTYIVDGIGLDIPLEIADYSCVGSGSIQIGEKYADFRLNIDDYYEVVKGIDGIEITLDYKADKKICEIIQGYTDQYEHIYQDEFLESGYESIKNPAVICFILMALSVFSVITFVEIYLRMQKKEMILFLRFGATIGNIKKLYYIESMLAGVFSYVISGVLAWLLCNLLKLSFDHIDLISLALIFILFMLVYMIETAICVHVSVKNLTKMS